MARAPGNDLAELFGFTPDDQSKAAKEQRSSQLCPFTGGLCIKKAHPGADGTDARYGSCSVVNRTRSGVEEVIICPQRLYAENYATLRACIADAVLEKQSDQIYMAGLYSSTKLKKKLPPVHWVLLGQKSGREISLKKNGVALSLDWVMVKVSDDEPVGIIPCEVQSIDITGNYRENWRAYMKNQKSIPDSRHGMNWANVWKRLIPQIILKASVAATSKLCTYGFYFVLPDRVFVQFEKLVGQVPKVDKPGHGILSVMTYGLGREVPPGSIRKLEQRRVVRMSTIEFAKAFASGAQLPMGTQLDEKVKEAIKAL